MTPAPTTAQVFQSVPTPPVATQAPAPVVVVGAGPVGVHFVEKLLKQQADSPVVLYGREPWDPYDRVQLSAFLAGRVERQSIFHRFAPEQATQVDYRKNCSVVAIDRDKQEIIDDSGRRQRYSRLILATGSYPHVPSIPGAILPGVFTFRNLHDLEQLRRWLTTHRKAVVVGGGLLGLECARAIRGEAVDVTVIQHASRLMNRQLDVGAAATLQAEMEALKIDVIVGEQLREIIGGEQVEAVHLRERGRMPVDTVIFATGIVPSIELALGCGLRVGRGIQVNDEMRTNDPNIFAIGECAEHRGQIYGLVTPGLDQAGVAAHIVAGGHAQYRGSTRATHLKVVGLPVYSIGRVAEEEQTTSLRYLVYQVPDQRIYRKLILERGRLVGAIATGEWGESARIQESVGRRRYVLPWQRRRFRRTGLLYPEATAATVAHWPAGAVVCNCRGVTRGTLSEAMSQGCTTPEALARQTGASTVCGACAPRLAELVGQAAPRTSPPAVSALVVASLLAGFGALLLALVPALPPADSVQVRFDLSRLWIDGFWKQVSGFTLLGLSVVALMLSLRKRVRLLNQGRFQFGRFAYWRAIHGTIGAATLAVLFLHTGMSLGDNLNLALMSVFLAIVALGGVAGFAAAVEHRLSLRAGAAMRAWSNRLHLWLFWPLPVLLSFHILKVYYF